MIENISVRSEQVHGRFDEAGGTPAESPQHPLDSEENKKLLGKLQEWWTQAREAHSINRQEQALDSDFYDGLQWSDEDAAELRARGQAPLVYNRVKPAVDWIIGTEKRSRFDFKVLARRDEESESADRKTGLLKYLADTSNIPYHRSMAFMDAVKVGIGWTESGVRNDSTDEKIFTRHESWRNMWYDPLSVEPDLSDARYVFRSKYIDLDIAQEMFPSRKYELEAAAESVGSFVEEDEDQEFLYSRSGSTGNTTLKGKGYVDGSTVFNRRERVRMIECWYRVPKGKSLLRGDRFNGVEYDKTNQEHIRAVDEGVASVYDSLQMEVRCAVFTDDVLLQDMPSPYRHNRFPFTVYWGYRRGRDRMPYGVIRNIRDPQENLNKRMSKALHILSSAQIIAEADATSDWDDVREEMARPDGIILLDGRKGARFESIVDKSLAREHVSLMEIDAQMIQDVSGITDENMGRTTNAVSGRAVTARQEQGAVITTDLFDNLRFAMQQQGEIMLSLVEQFMDYTQTIRVLGDNGQPEYMDLNLPVVDPVTGEVRILNDITATQADFIMDQQEYRATQRRAMFDMFAELFKSMDPEITIKLLDLMFEYSDLPGREEIVSRIRKINGETDPAKKNDPEEMARIQAELQQQAEQAELEKRRIMAELAKVEAEANKVVAEADRIKSEAVRLNIEALKGAMEAAHTAVTIPATTAVADEIAASAGYVDKNQPPVYPPVTEPAALPVQRQERTLINQNPNMMELNA